MFVIFSVISVFYDGKKLIDAMSVLRRPRFQDPPERRKLRLIESNAKCRHLKKFTCKGLQQDSTSHTPLINTCRKAVMGKHPDLMVAHPTSTIFTTIGRNYEIS